LAIFAQLERICWGREKLFTLEILVRFPLKEYQRKILPFCNQQLFEVSKKKKEGEVELALIGAGKGYNL
jgi:hypothetical protein